MQLQTKSPESKFPNEYTAVISFRSINIWKSYCQKTKGSRFLETRCIWCSMAHHWLGYIHRKSPFSEKLSMTLTFKPMTLNMSPGSCEPGNEKL